MRRSRPERRGAGGGGTLWCMDEEPIANSVVLVSPLLEAIENLANGVEVLTPTFELPLLKGLNLPGLRSINPPLKLELMFQRLI